MIDKHQSDKQKATDWAKGILADPAVVILDTETTDFRGEPVEISIIDVAGQTLLNTLVKPTLPIAAGAYDVHGLGLDELKGAPGFPEIYPELCRVLGAASRIVIYNAQFDHGILEGARKLYKLPAYPMNDPDFFPWWNNLECAMEWYAQWYGEWNGYRNNYKWQRLNGGHRALGDCVATLELVRKMAHANP